MKDENKIKAESIKELKTLRKKTEESALNNVTKRNASSEKRRTTCN